MERTHYRQHTPSRLYTSRPMADKSEEHNVRQYPSTRHSETAASTGGIREKLIVQGIISGVILAVVLAFSLTDNPQTTAILINLNRALSTHITVEQVVDGINRFLEESLPFEWEAAYTENLSIFEPESLPTEYTPLEGQLTVPRIDENMMRELLGESENDYIQTTAPEPITLPEL